ncbi:MAG TPA: hypothetical protein VHB79_12005 [Polyangiaceae bacterium]|nr:hypothetical protein [Polyangiaceae bacterium]
MSLETPTPPAPNAARGLFGGLLATLLLAGEMAWLWGYTVDDALISCRVAWHLARGLGYRFNATGPVVDAVTPLGWAHLLALVGGTAGPLVTLLAAKWLGALAVAGAGVAAGRRAFTRASAAYAGGLVLCLALCAPLAAWAVSGMETGAVTALAVAALGNGRWADLAAALAAALRPELAPWAVTVRVGLRVAQGVRFSRALAGAGVVLAGPLLAAALRALWFGRPAPLAVFAKPSDFEHGVSYALHAFVQTGLPLLGVAPLALRRGAPLARALVGAGLVHFAALALAGGDWMSLYRLAVPVLPSFVLVGAELWRVAPAWASWLRLACATAMSLYVARALGPTARQVGPARERLIAEAAAPLAGAKTVATLDVGWVGAVADFTVVDLAGVTDEGVAMLPGGHTSKRVSDALLRARNVDALVLLSDRDTATPDDYVREVERRVALADSVREFRVVARLPLGGTAQSYVVLRKP